MALCLRIGLSLVLVLCLAASAGAGMGSRLLARARQLYFQADFQAAGASLREAIVGGDLTRNELARAYALLGLVYWAQGGLEHAARAFRLARRADPGYQPDPQVFPPEALALYHGRQPPPFVPQTTAPPSPPRRRPGLQERPLTR